MKFHRITIGRIEIGRGRPLALIAGPCVIESEARCLRQAEQMAAWSRRRKIPLIFKASFDKANRSSHRSFRGLGLRTGLAILAKVKEYFRLPILTDIHSADQVQAVAEVADVLQIPAFLCRQTDLLIAAARSGRCVNVKKGQFLSPGDMRHIVAKLEDAGSRQILLTERGTTFGYNNLVVDMRSLAILRQFGYPVIFDATHSVQQPGAAGDHSGGEAAMAPVLARAAVAAGCDGIFIETHPQPSRALSDSETMLPLSSLPSLYETLRALHGLAK